MRESIYSVSQAVELLGLQSHVLRYWEEEMRLPIGRNEMGHRYYTRWDIQVFLSIKELKKKGYTLKEIGELTAFFYKKQEKTQKTETKVLAKKTEAEVSGKEKPETEEKRKFSPEFMEILCRIVESRLQEKNSEEVRFKRLDQRIRTCQQTRREAAASAEKKNSKKKKFFAREKGKVR